MKLGPVWLALALSQAGAAQDTPSPAPGPPIGIGGIAGFTCVSSLEFTGVENQPHTLAVDYMFPDRARWSLNATDGRDADRTLYYRFGEEVWTVHPGSKRSSAITAEDRDATLRQMELRRALMLYPLGFEWSEPSERRRSAPVQRRSDSSESAIGQLEVELDESGRPASMRVIDAEGETVESLHVRAWQTQRRRTFPKQLTLVVGGRTTWTEVVTSLDTRLTRIDAYFRPSDQRVTTTTLVGNQVVRAVDMRAITYREHELPKDSAWTDALALAADWIEAARDELGEAGPAVDRVPSFELNENGLPTRCIVRLEDVVTHPPAGWLQRPDRPGLGVLVDGVRGASARALALMLRAAPEGSRLGTPYCRVTAPEGRASVQLYVPLLRPE